MAGRSNSTSISTSTSASTSTSTSANHNHNSKRARARYAWPRRIATALVVDGFTMLLMGVVTLTALAVPAAADCECGYATTIDGHLYSFTDLIETDFAHLSDISTNTDWVRQAFNISSEKARGSYGEMFAVQNIFTNPNPSGVRVEDGQGSDGQPAGLQLSVNASHVDDLVPVAEIDTARLDVLFGTYRASLKITDVPGTCSAFFWVSGNEVAGRQG